MRIVENRAETPRRKRRQHLYQSPDDAPTKGIQGKSFRPRQFADWRDLSCDIVEQKQVQEAVAKALGELPQIYREVFVLRDMQHLDVAETAGILGLDESAVKTRLHRARLMLREALTPMFAKPKVSVWERWTGPWFSCKTIIANLSDYLDGNTPAEMLHKIECHLRSCHRCSAVYDSTRKMLVITGDERICEVPAGFSERLQSFLDKVISRPETP